MRRRTGEFSSANAEGSRAGKGRKQGQTVKALLDTLQRDVNLQAAEAINGSPRSDTLGLYILATLIIVWEAIWRRSGGSVREAGGVCRGGTARDLNESKTRSRSGVDKRPGAFGRAGQVQHVGECVTPFIMGWRW